MKKEETLNNEIEKLKASKANCLEMNKNHIEKNAKLKQENHILRQDIEKSRGVPDSKKKYSTDTKIKRAPNRKHAEYLVESYISDWALEESTTYGDYQRACYECVENWDEWSEA
jgi:hypothetical protein